MGQATKAEKELLDEDNKYEEILRGAQQEDVEDQLADQGIEEIGDDEHQVQQLREVKLDEDFDVLYNDYYEPMLGIEGEQYEPLKKLTMYMGLANALKDNFIYAGFNHDMRINSIICLPPGSGKRLARHALRLSILPHMTAEKPTSLHSEHLVGKVTWDKKKKELIDHQGHLENDMVLLEESQKLFTDPNFAPGLKYIREALDPIGKNEVVKSTADVPGHQRKRFWPDCTVVFFCQPVTYPPDLVFSGDLRRNIVVYFELNVDHKFEILEKKLKQMGARKEANLNIMHYKNIVYSLQKYDFNWQISPELKAKVIDYCKRLFEYASWRGMVSEKVATDTIFDIGLHLMRFTLIRAAVEGRQKPKMYHLKKAYNDFLPYFEYFCDFSNNLLNEDDIITKNTSKQMNYKIKKVVKWLYSKSALAGVSHTTYREVLEYIKIQGWGSVKGGTGAGYKVWQALKNTGYIEMQIRKHKPAIVGLNVDKAKNILPSRKFKKKGDLQRER